MATTRRAGRLLTFPTGPASSIPDPACPLQRFKRRVTFLSASGSPSRDSSRNKARRATLVARRKLTVPFSGPSQLADFLSRPAGMETLINTNALQHFEPLGDSVYRCYLPKVDILKFEVSPIVDLSITVSATECMVKLLSCKFEGSELVEQQNERFSAFMKNHLTWGTSEADQTLNVDVELDVSLEVYTLPFTLLPLAAVEAPGSLVLQAMVDRLVPIFLDRLSADYQKWTSQVPLSEEQ